MRRKPAPQKGKRCNPIGLHRPPFATVLKRTLQMDGVFWWRRGESFAFASRTNVSTSVCTGRSGFPPGSRDFDFRLSRFPPPPEKRTCFCKSSFLVEAGRVELPSESSLTGTSPGAVCYLHSLIRPGADTLPDSVASSMHGTGKAYRTHVLHSNDTRARLVDLSGRMGRPN